MHANSHLYREIREQPEVISRLIRNETEAARELAEAIKHHGITHVVIAARGTSDNAARYAKYVLGSMNALIVALAAPSLFSIYQRPPEFGRALVLGISQSGKSPDIVAVLAEAKRQKALSSVITNSPGSELAQQADIVIHLNAGEKKAVAPTKTYTAELAAIALLSTLLKGDEEMMDALQELPSAMAGALTMNQAIAQIAPRYRYMERSVVIGRGYNYATASELALKMKELTYTIAEPYSSADFLHGPLAMIDQGFPVIVVAPSGAMEAEMGTFVDALNERNAEVICISDDRNLLSRARTPLCLPYSVPEWLSPVTAILPGQLFSLHLASARDHDVDAPRRLRKVTETR